MKRFGLIFLALLPAFGLGYLARSFEPRPAAAGEPPPEDCPRWTPDRRGDVNGDERLDLSDAMFILNFCYRNGPVPPLLPAAPRGLPATGQTLCFSGDRGDEQTPCPGPGMVDHGQDPGFKTGFPHEFELVKVVEGDPATWYTIDHSTRLMWQHRDDGVRRNWRQGLLHAENLELGGFDDWRLPNVMELYSIVDIGRNEPAVNGDFFRLQSLLYWTSSSCLYDTSRAWTVRFNQGLVGCLDKGGQGQTSFQFQTLAVRSLD
jgi:hypothetical protein